MSAREKGAKERESKHHLYTTKASTCYDCLSAARNTMQYTRRDLGKTGAGRAAGRQTPGEGELQVGRRADRHQRALQLPQHAARRGRHSQVPGPARAERRRTAIAAGGSFLQAPVVPPAAGRGKPAADARSRSRRARPRSKRCSKWRLALSVDEMKSFRKKYNDAGVLIEIVKVDGIDAMPDDVVDYCFTLAKTLGAKALSCEIPLSETKRLGEFALKHKLMVGYHGHANVTSPEAFGRPESWETAMTLLQVQRHQPGYRPLHRGQQRLAGRVHQEAPRPHHPRPHQGPQDAITDRTFPSDRARLRSRKCSS